MTPEQQRRLVGALDASVKWLLSSGVRTTGGGLRSIYRSGPGQYVTYGGGESCLQCTAGGVLALLAAARGPSASGPGSAECLDAAVESAEHLLDLIRPGPGPGEGAIPCGLGADTVKTLHTEAALRAFLAVHEATGDDRWLDGAARAARWAVSKLQRSDGSFRGGTAFTPYARLRRRLFDVSPIGAAAYVRTLRKLGKVAGEPAFEKAASKLFAWLRERQDAEGGFPMYRYHWLTRPIAATLHGGFAELWRGCLRYHPSPNAWMIEAFLAMDDEAGARRVSEWIVPRFGPNGLLYQYYYPAGAGGSSVPRDSGGVVSESYGSRSIEEDVMPTAGLALHWMRHPGIVPGGRASELLERIASGIEGAQVRGSDPRTNGGVRGLPLHPQRHDDIYTWDTIYTVLFLAAYLKKISTS